ncbi:T. brucei spp.-specific protein [Trypanosoma brucei gambiense DAL972]|uniref:T. brucei spp.-specific protein n=1 Tax=Trypanosoma brucei gambiense (strain MHOM/CI/86/DAL972) TaxID=679716 RepID=C9ZQ06_TRYB9|nr:T. brucei spp.-specific protein [Trypanosoma brucei gambiense DAL972]CBH11484.1 T. brucei spp.-specific protein [Trypanosoma brucei gambiense DAL972]|eukprot:XP_011773771.1 T. brucei spp.-specific protein [Trypanosoma brucei gambiense DAL972]
MGATRQNGVSPNTPSVSRPRGQQPSSGTGVSDQQQETQGSVASSSAVSRGTNQLGSDGEETFLKADVKQVDGSAGSLGRNPIAQPSDSAREPTDAQPRLWTAKKDKWIREGWNRDPKNNKTRKTATGKRKMAGREAQGIMPQVQIAGV